MAKTNAAVFFVTGKGGVGKSYLAETLARGAARGGLRTVLVRTHAALVRAAAGPIGAAAGATAAGPPKAVGDEDHDGLRTVDLDTRECLHDFLTRSLRFRFLSDRLMNSRTFSAVAAAAPGLADLVTLSAITELARGRRHGVDFLVVDAPASGHSLPLLASPERILDLIGIGPAASIARTAREMITDADRCRALVVTLPEELSLSEASLLSRDIRALGVRLAPAVVNGVYPELTDPEQRAWLEREAPSESAAIYLRTCARQRELIEAFQREVGATLSVPFSFSGQPTSDVDATALVAKILESAV